MSPPLAAFALLAACTPPPPPPPPEPIALACDAQVMQAGLAFCRTQPSATLRNEAGAPLSVADETGLALIGVDRDATSPLSLIAEPKPEPPPPPPPPPPFPISLFVDPPAPPPPRFARSAPVAIEIAPRTDEIRTVKNVACDRIAPRSPEMEAKVEADRAIKAEAWKRVHAPLADEIRFAPPSDGPLTSPFGAVRDYVTPGCPPYQSVHWGLDIGTPPGWPARAPMAGTVILAQPDLYYEGNAVFIDHGRGLVSMLMHLSRIDVAVGDRIEAGGQVGLTGATGRVNGAHMHWAIRWRSEAGRDFDVMLDPALLLVDE
jgi:hypothetical protein